MAVEQNITNWIETKNGVAHLDRISNIFYAAIAAKDEEDDGEPSKDPTHGVWATLVSGENIVVFEGTEDQAQAIVEGLRSENSATNLATLIPDVLWDNDDDDE